MPKNSEYTVSGKAGAAGMTRRTRLALLTAAGCGALALAGSASAGYSPRLVVDPASTGAGGASPITISFTRPAGDQSTAHATIYAPLGLATKVNPAVGSVLGTARVTGTTLENGGTAFAMTGKITADDPAEHKKDGCAPYRHDQVWLLTLAGSGRSMTLPVYVDHVDPAAATAGFASFQFDMCLDSPAVAGTLAVVGVSLHLAAGTLHTPGGTAEVIWRGFFTPYLAGSTTASAKATVESRAILRQPMKLSLLRKVVKKGTVLLSGVLNTAGQKVAGATVTLLGGSTPSKQKVVSSTRTSKAGAYKFLRKVTKTTYFRTRVTAPARDMTAEGCKASSLAPAGCVTATLQPLHLLSAPAKVTVK